ncbi:protein SanA, affects membrane permeability for vancomycin [Massilia sp. CF038]|nr:protein SanA, affects membrane permeability for vancomycin [Massilia sp. CF038]
MAKAVTRFFGWSLSVVLVCFLCAAAVISMVGLTDSAEETDLAVVPGNTVLPSGAVSPRLKGRLDAAANLFLHGKVKAVLVSGGIGAEGFDEADVMKRYLVAQGIPGAAIVTDNKGINTFETARYTAALVREKGYRPPIVVTQFFHIARMELALQKFGVATGGHVHARHFEARDVYSLAREVFGYAGYAFKQPDSVR